MLYSQRSRPRHREVTGPQPHSVAVVAKFPSSRPRDFAILERRRHEEAREQILTFTKLNTTERVKNKWARVTDQKLLHNMVQREVYRTMEEYKMHLNERRERLSTLLEREEMAYIKEMEAMEETTLERQAKMRERVKSLREKREKERMDFIAEKRDQQFREQCEELRSLRSQIHLNEVCTERMAQIVLKEELNRQRKEEDTIFDQLWEQDRLAKEEQEEKKRQKRIELNQEIACLQKAASEAQKMQEKRLKEEESKLMAEEQRLIKLEEERNLKEKQQNKLQVKSMLEDSIRLKMKRLAREQQEELALDMKILEHVMQGYQDDTEEKRQRKMELRKEQQLYREYLAQQLEEEKRQEREMDKMIEAELEKSWAKKSEQMRKEKEARKRLMKDVMDTRRVQIQEKLERNAKLQEELAHDKELLESATEEHKQLETDRNARQMKVAQQYQRDLVSQVAYQQSQRQAEREEEQREFEAGLTAEKAYQNKLREILSRPYVGHENIHPLRRGRISSPKDWLPQ
ncbi:cilia- and flagella-associated protein 53 isoform X2 [Xenopus laevis]|uniref:Cilia- and flagella-associated protein 53 n=2 Tax=Xenopus laevis TaxID=8355 RepID=CFA53_XENLA|nr:cilia- and flagella-associated protein 53 isoform X2 [Xenopus laevis]XP_018122464.1 cilia- and flagella-associated protein 53 isoform X2 [Xenopus laevis]XP_018122474.1 cilia- and flagella-associated protein 53 isoform X2 [Xenopus laevis]XP_018122483.1 cilia- and flagella-associated protein 53 isoform X2 [Xenopus laevis]OCU02689.1 hypothetical protein XELAEV_18008455mg [Xenopus laevis]